MTHGYKWSCPFLDNPEYQLIAIVGLVEQYGGQSVDGSYYFLLIYLGLGCGMKLCKPSFLTISLSLSTVITLLGAIWSSFGDFGLK